MKANRITYLLLCAATIMLGLLCRQLNVVPLFFGDVLYAVMSYWMFRFLFVNMHKLNAACYATGFCFAIELMQLIDTPFLNQLREHKLLRLVFGQGFLWTDLIAYCGGVVVAWLADKGR